MSHSPTLAEPLNEPTWDVPKERVCLRCKTTFLSQWSGERICSPCKRKSAWRNGH